mmetsp:Transcript_35867/g.55026  ORF Transcript_35867/g.55026 Transcript_35867/m.55026 type:complete len:82 (-) Transcript_35867:1776-2021(-)
MNPILVQQQMIQNMQYIQPPRMYQHQQKFPAKPDKKEAPKATQQKTETSDEQLAEQLQKILKLKSEESGRESDSMSKDEKI